MGEPVAGVPAIVHERMERLARGGAIPLTTVAMRARIHGRVVTRGTAYDVPPEMREAFAYGYTHPNWQDAFAYGWVRKPGQYRLQRRVRGG